MTTDRPEAATNGVPPKAAAPALGRSLLWIGLSAAVVSTAVTLVVLRTVVSKRAAPPDETAERIQSLIDEANRLLKKIDEAR